MIIDSFMIYQFLKRLATPFKKWPAFKAGVIDHEGKILIKPNDRNSKQKSTLKYFDIIVMNLKKLLGKLPGGKSPIATYAAALLLLKESQNSNSTLTEDMSNLEERLFEEIANVTNNVAGVKGGDEPPVFSKKKRKIEILKRTGIEESTYYHGTSQENAKHILKHGFDSNKSKYDNTLYLTKMHHVAQKYGKIQNNGKHPVVLKVHKDNIDHSKVKSEHSGIMQYSGKIHPDHISTV